MMVTARVADSWGGQGEAPFSAPQAKKIFFAEKAVFIDFGGFGGDLCLSVCLDAGLAWALHRMVMRWEQPPAWKLLLLAYGCGSRTWPLAQRLWLRTQQVKMLALQRLRDESDQARQRVAAAALRVLLDADLAALVIPNWIGRVAALGGVCHALRSAAEREPELVRCLDAQGGLIWCSVCRRRLRWHNMWEHEHAMCKPCMMHMIDTMSCNAWAEWKHAWKYG